MLTTRATDMFHGVPLHVARRIRSRSTHADHKHEFMELVIAFSGSATHSVCGNRSELCAGDVIVITPRQYHAYEYHDNFGYYDILFDPRLLGLARADIFCLSGYHALFALEPSIRESNSLSPSLRLSAEQLAQITCAAAAIEAELDGGLPGKYFSATALFMTLVVRLCRMYDLNTGSGKNGRPPLPLARVLSYIECNLHERLTTDELAGVGNLSRSSLIRAFEKQLGIPPLEYINQRRLNIATDALRASDLPVGQIALAAGFSDSNYFARYFRKRMGMTPGQFRKQAQPGK